MLHSAVATLPDLYEEDETAWLEAIADLIREGRYAELDYPHLAEFLTDMAKRDRREVESRLAVLITHVLKWTYQPDKRTRSWRATIIEQRHELDRNLGRSVLRNHEEAVLAEMYTEAVERTAAETGLSAETFHAECPYTLEELLSPDLLSD